MGHVWIREVSLYYTVLKLNVANNPAMFCTLDYDTNTSTYTGVIDEGGGYLAGVHCIVWLKKLSDEWDSRWLTIQFSYNLLNCVCVW